jgi:hypothetical protein
VIGRLEAVDVTTSRHADADEQSRRRRSRLRFVSRFRASIVQLRRGGQLRGMVAGREGMALACISPANLVQKDACGSGVGVGVGLGVGVANHGKGFRG